MDYEGFKKIFLRLTDINLSLYKESQMKRRILNFMEKKECKEDYNKFINLLKSNKNDLEEFVTFLTINVTEFYRNVEYWHVLKEKIVPDLLKHNKKIKVWSSACSTGEEPYSLVILLNQILPLAEISILATDLDEESIKTAKEGIYKKSSLKNLPEEYINKYFNKKDDLYHIKDEVKKCVDFKKFDLLKDKYPYNIDLILCRNVLIYFTDEAKNLVYEKFSRALSQKGVLFLGATEQIINPSSYNLFVKSSFFYGKLI